MIASNNDPEGKPMTTSLFPVSCTDAITTCRDFYSELLGLDVIFEADWYVQLQHPDRPEIQIAFVRPDHNSVPEGYRAPAQGVIVTIEHENVDAVHEQATALRLPIALPLRDEAWGQRHFMTRDPAGQLVDVFSLIPPQGEYAQTVPSPSS